MNNRNGEVISAQVSMFGPITGLNDGNFHLEDGNAFLIKNDGTAEVELEVLPAGSTDGEFVTTKFATGWNPEIVKEIKATSLSMLNLKFGY
jgi:hypothetical protein bfra3_11886|nr:MAG TPA: hypothetical protein [Caudoviricetes sp.]